jgi:hypothetical protein
MYFFTRRHSGLLLLAAVVILCASPREGFSQTVMSFSYYTDATVAEDLVTLYTVVNGYDNSSGCSHTNYQTYASLSAPSGFYDGWFSGLAAWFDVPAEEGDFTIDHNSWVQCDCVGYLDAGGESQVVIRVRPFTARMLYSTAASDPEPHGPTSHDKYYNDGCSGFCQPAFLDYDHSAGLGHGWIEITGFDTENPRMQFRYCAGNSRGKNTRPDCKPT